MDDKSAKACLISKYLNDFADEWKKLVNKNRCGLRASFCDDYVIISGDMSEKSEMLLVTAAADQAQALRDVGIHVENEDTPLHSPNLENNTFFSMSGSKFALVKSTNDNELTPAKAIQDIVKFKNEQPYKKLLGLNWN